MKHIWEDGNGSDGDFELIDGRIYAYDGDSQKCNIYSIAQARALHEALGRALEDVERQPDILRRIDAACDVMFSGPRRPMPPFTPDPPLSAESLIERMRADLRKLADVCGGSLASVTDSELAQMGMRRAPSQPEPLPPDHEPLVIGRAYICDGSRSITVTLPPGKTLLQGGDPTHEVIDGVNSAEISAGQSFRFVMDGSEWKLEDEPT